MSISSRLEAINQHLLDDYSILTLGGADLTNVDKNIQNLKTQWKSRLEYYLANGLDVVWNNWNKITGSGTEISLNNTIEAKMDFVYKGNTQQNGTPTPDAPIPVQVVSGDNTIKVEGKNLIDGIWEQGNINATTGANENANDRARTINYIPVTPNVSYYISRNSATSNNSYRFYDKDKNYLGYNATSGMMSGTNLTSNIYNGTFTILNTNVKYMRIVETGQTSSTISQIKYLLQTSNIIDTTYTPYTSQTYPINLGSIELCKIGTYQDKIAKSSGKNITNYSNWEQGNFYVDGTGINDNVDSANVIRMNDFVDVEPNTTYTLSCNQILGQLGYIYKDTSNNMTGAFQNTGEKYYTFTTPSNCKQVRLRIGNSSYPKTYGNEYEIMLNKGSTALPYEPYGTDWYKYSAIGKVVLNGSENWQTGIYGTNSYSLAVSNLKTSTNGADYILLVLSNNFMGKRFVDRTTGNNIVYSDVEANNGLYFRNTEQTSTANWKTWLGTHNTDVYYVLATPTYTKITDQTLIYQLEQIKYSYSSQTNISQTNNDMPFELDVNALESM